MLYEIRDSLTFNRKSNFVCGNLKSFDVIDVCGLSEVGNGFLTSDNDLQIPWKSSEKIMNNTVILNA
jgi:hypothetical protein